MKNPLQVNKNIIELPIILSEIAKLKKVVKKANFLFLKKAPPRFTNTQEMIKALYLLFLVECFVAGTNTNTYFFVS